MIRKDLKWIPYQVFLFAFLGMGVSMVEVANGQTVLSLAEAMRTAVQNNASLRAEQFNINIAESDVITAKLRPNPIFNNTSMHTFGESNFYPATKWNSKYNNQILWQVSKPIQPHRQRKYKIETANKLVDFSAEGYENMKCGLYADVAYKWLDVWVLEKRISKIAIAADNLDSLVEINKFRYEKQMISRSDLLRTEVLARQYRLHYKQVEQDLINQKQELKFLLGVDYDVQVDTTDQGLSTTTLSMDSIMSFALRERGEIKVLQKGIYAAQSDIKLQKAFAIPTPEVGFFYNPQNAVPYAGLFITIDIPVFSRNQGERQKAYFFKEQFEQEYLSMQQQTRTEVTNAYEEYVLLLNSINKYKELLVQSDEILESVRYAYLSGGTTIIDFLEAQRGWLDMQEEYYDILSAHKQSYITLFHVSDLISQIAE
jgi:cobalt-zinc-cadmium efflux system outer membrane protein